MDEFRPHEYHVEFLLYDMPLWYGSNLLPTLISRLDDLDPVDRKWMIDGWIIQAYKLARDSQREETDDEDFAERQFMEFKAKCMALTETILAGHYFVWSFISYALSTMYRRARGTFDDNLIRCAQIRLENAKLLNNLSGDEIAETEETVNNQAATTQVFRKRYHIFCEQLAKPVLQFLDDSFGHVDD